MKKSVGGGGAGGTDGPVWNSMPTISICVVESLVLACAVRINLLVSRSKPFSGRKLVISSLE